MIDDTILTRTVTIMERTGNGTFEAKMDDEKPYHTLHLAYEVWQDMGQPEILTVTIEPGDNLNT